jgi:outer membrane protein OmpA-like peptidoglycan-associated protein
LHVDLGLNTFVGDMTPDLNRSFTDPLSHWSVGAGVEYTINPMFAVGLGYTFHRIGHSDDRASFESNVHNIFPYIGINMLNHPLFRRNNRWDLWFTAGVGLASYTPQLTYNEATLNFPAHYTQDQRDAIISPDFGRRQTAVIPLGLELSYDITRQLALALRAQVFLYGADDLEGAPAKLWEPDNRYNRKNYTLSGTSNDMIATVGLTLRWNITGRDRTHMRKVTWEDAKMPRVPDLSDVLARLDTLENRMDNLRDVVENFAPIVITEHHGGETVLLNTDGVSDPIFIFFAFDKHYLDHTALAEVLRIATILDGNENLNVDVVGLTDIRGSVAYNQALSDRRANEVRNELVNVWGISPDRITHEGKGKAVSPQPNSPRYFSINRRAEVRFYRR